MLAAKVKMTEKDSKHMSKSINCVNIFITLKGIEKLKTDKMVAKQSKQTRGCASGLKYSSARHNLLLARKMCRTKR